MDTDEQKAVNDRQWKVLCELDIDLNSLVRPPVEGSFTTYSKGYNDCILDLKNLLKGKIKELCL